MQDRIGSTSLYFVALLLVAFQGCQLESLEPLAPIGSNMFSEVDEYLVEISLGSEFGGLNDRLIKWNKDVKIFIQNPEQDELVMEFEKILIEINDLSTTIRLRRTLSEDDANFHILFSDGQSYAEFEPNATNHVKENRGLVWIYWNNKFEITRGSLYVDVPTVQDLSCQKHLLREELTQGLGLLNDSFRHPESIFQQNWTCTTSYTDIDKELLKLFLSRNLTAGMTREFLATVLSTI